MHPGLVSLRFLHEALLGGIELPGAVVALCVHAGRDSLDRFGAILFRVDRAPAQHLLPICPPVLRDSVLYLGYLAVLRADPRHRSAAGSWKRSGVVDTKGFAALELGRVLDFSERGARWRQRLRVLFLPRSLPRAGTAVLCPLDGRADDVPATVGKGRATLLPSDSGEAGDRVCTPTGGRDRRCRPLLHGHRDARLDRCRSQRELSLGQWREHTKLQGLGCRDVVPVRVVDPFRAGPGGGGDARQEIGSKRSFWNLQLKRKQLRHQR